MIKITIRKIENKANEYFAYRRGLQGKATYLLYFSDDIYGAIARFIQMLRGHFKTEEIDFQIAVAEIKIKSEGRNDRDGRD